ncbi:hypothetical protein HG537_0E05400 [Torulaspora globosa]|uniref:GP-PDE domain-containing protein n=1 Tax=Torulaspora globosa TaxID=48254 RepID=A0A7H9HXF5_9SACH|nr:hypothetical protein HG537_0E05400 [Torulaspora sp. CBS 2947]
MIQIVGHRAFKGQYVENSWTAFERAYEGKADVIETDLQMTSDGVVVINHDADTGRIWDRELVIADHRYEEICKLRCKEDRNLQMPTLEQLLRWAVDHPRVQLMLDIKFTNSKLILLKSFATMLRVKNDIAYWQSRIIWGLWLLDWFEYGIETGVLRDFKIVVITLSLDVACQFIDYSLQLNNPHYKLYGISVHYVASWTDKFRLKMAPVLKKYDIKVFLWTVNKVVDFKCMAGLPIHGVVTDDPVVARRLCLELSPMKDFKLPDLATVNGFRFHLYLLVYRIVCSLLFAKWAHYSVGGWSFAYLVFLLLKKIHFL